MSATTASVVAVGVASTLPVTKLPTSDEKTTDVVLGEK